MLDNYSRVIKRMQRHSIEVPEVYVRRSALHALYENFSAARSDALRAVELCEKGQGAGTLEPRADRPAPSDRAYFRLGVAEYGLQNFEASCKAFQRGLEYQPTSTRLLQALGVVMGVLASSDRGESGEINLNFEGLGDQKGAALAEALEALPKLKVLCVQDNRFTDISLHGIINACRNSMTLTKLDLGSNKMDEQASVALANFLKISHCPLKILKISHADVDDGECCELMEKLKENRSVEELDLSHNLIGAHEARNIVIPEFDTGPEIVAEFLQDYRCMLVVLNLSWNSIRKDSARQLSEAIGRNKTLEVVDLSYNAFGDVGGQAIGDMLHHNASLVKLDLSNNAVNPHAAFTIACGLRHNTTICEMNLRGNPIGDIGGRALMQVSIDTGDHVELHLEQCSMTFEDPRFTIDKDTNLPKEACDEPQKDAGGKTRIIYKCDLSVPYRRAVAYEVLRIAAERPGYNIEKTKLSGEEVRLERVMLKRGAKDVQLIKQIDEAENDFDEFWERYDIDRSQTIDEMELSKLLADLRMPASVGNVTRIMKMYDTKDSGSLDKEEMIDFLQNAKKDVRERTKPRTVMAEAGRLLPYRLPSIFLGEAGNAAAPQKEKGGKKGKNKNDGFFEIQLSISPEREEVNRSTSSMEIRKIMAVARNAENRLLALQLSLGHMQLHVEEARELIKEIRQGVVNPIEVLCMVLPYTSNAQHARTLVTLELKDNAMRNLSIADKLSKASEVMTEGQFEAIKRDKMQQVDKIIERGRRELEGKLGPAFKPIMGMYTGHFVCNLSKDMDRLCMTKLGEQNNLEIKLNRFRFRRIDTSQKGNWSCFRNETFNGSSRAINNDFFDPLPLSGRVEFDFVSTARPGAQIAAIRQQRFTTLFQELRWIESDAEAEIMAGALEMQYGPVHRMDERDLSIYDHEIESLRSFLEDRTAIEKQETRRQPTLERGSVSDGGSLSSRSTRTGSSSFDSPSPKAGDSDGGASPAESGRRVDAREALAHLRDEISSHWITCKQAQWIVRNCPVSTIRLYRDVPKDWKVDLVVDLHSRIVDLVYFDVVLEVLRPRERARAIHRLGLLNCFSPTRPEHLYTLDLSHREDRIVVKLLVHMSTIEPGTPWKNQRFRHSRGNDDVDGWELTTMWFREDGLPSRGNLRVEYYSGGGSNVSSPTSLESPLSPNPSSPKSPKSPMSPGSPYSRSFDRCKPNVSLRALLQGVVLADELPEHEGHVLRATDGGSLARSDAIADSLRNKAAPPILWKYQT